MFYKHLKICFKVFILFLISTFAFVSSQEINAAYSNIFTWPMNLDEVKQLARCVDSVYAYKDWVFLGCARDSQVTIYTWANNKLEFKRRIPAWNNPGFGRFITIDHSSSDTNHLIILSTNQMSMIPYDKDKEDWLDVTTETTDCTVPISMLSDQSQAAFTMPSVILSNPLNDQVNIGTITWDSPRKTCTFKQWDRYITAPSSSKSFGTTLMVNANILYIGAPLDSDETCSNYKGGNVHVYDLSKSTIVKKIQPSDAITVNCDRNPKFGLTLADYPGTGTGVIIGMQDLSTDGYVFYYDGSKLNQIMLQAYAGRQMTSFKSVYNTGGQTKMQLCSLGAKHIWCYSFDDSFLLDIPFESSILYSNALVSKYGLILGGTNYIEGNSTMYAPTPTPTVAPTWAPTTIEPTEAPTPTPTGAPTAAPTTTPQPTEEPTESPKDKTGIIIIVVLSVLVVCGGAALLLWHFNPNFNLNWRFQWGSKTGYKNFNSKGNKHEPLMF